MQLSIANSLLKDLIHSSLSFLSHPRGFASWFFICARDRDQIPLGTRSLPAPAAFLALLSDYREGPDKLDHDAQYWWTSSGFALAILLEKAGYASDAQYRLLEFIRAIVPSLGAGPLPGRQPRWKSFMTDDHTPIELSWDWRTGGKSPKIRFSIEPVGVHAGTSVDPYNQHAAAKLRDTMRQRLPHTNAAWLAHFQHRLGSEEAAPAGVGPVEGHLSKEFYAFDLNEDGNIMSKAYFFPGFKARETQRSNFHVIKEAIETAPGCTTEKLRALRIFQDYVEDASSPSLEMDMLAIDLVDPSESRFKIYFRVRDTSFTSVRQAMSLGGRIKTPELLQGLEDLQRLYYSLLAGAQIDRDQVPADDTQLPTKDHRTAGILYNVEFRYGSTIPKVKAYLPVRHYARSEDAIISALEAYFSTKHLDDDTDSSAGWRTHVASYKEAVKTIL